MKLLSLFQHQKVLATGAGRDVDLTTYGRNVKFAYSAAKDAGTNPTLAAKLQASAGLARGLEQSTVGATDNKLKSGATTNVNLGLAFTQSGDHQVKRVALMLKNPGAITAGKLLTLTIQSDTAGSPSGTILGTAGTVLCSAVGATYAWVVFTFANPVDVADATVYHFVLSCDYTASSTDCIYWRSLTVGSGGTLETWDATNWASVTSTQAFEVYVDQYTFADVTGGGFTGLTTGTAVDPEEKNIDVRALGGPVLRLYLTIGGTSNPAYYAQCAMVASPLQEV